MIFTGGIQGQHVASATGQRTKTMIDGTIVSGKLHGAAQQGFDCANFTLAHPPYLRGRG